ncbi:hypothetical protein BH09MYX1_BH09MYX1_51940 [soil metagenome]
MSDKGFFDHDGLFWRRMASMGAQRLPRWWVRYSPPFFGLAAAALVTDKRKKVLRNLHRIRGAAPMHRDVTETSRTFMSYAGVLAEVLAFGSKNEEPPKSRAEGAERMHQALALGKGVILLTAHTAGWEIAGPLFLDHIKLDVVVVMRRERNDSARELQDNARAASGVRVLHVGDDPLASLPLLRHLQAKGAVAMQIDRPPPNGRTIPVSLLDGPDALPEGPFKLAQISGAPLVPVFTARAGFRDYILHVGSPHVVARRATAADLAHTAQIVSDEVTAFLREHPTQWFHW